MSRTYIRSIVLVALTLLAHPAIAQDRKQVERELRRQYEGKMTLLTLEPQVGNFELLLPKNERKTIERGGKVYLSVTEVNLKNNEVELRGRRIVPYVDIEGQKKFAAGRPGVYRLRWRGPTDAHEVQATLEQLLTAIPSFATVWSGPAGLGEGQEKGKQGQWYDDTLAASAERIGGTISAPVCILCPQPEYPEEVRRARVEGVVVLTTVISETGQPHSIQVSRSVSPQLDAAAAFTVGRWRFKPAMRSGKPVVVYMTIEIDFHLY